MENETDKTPMTPEAIKTTGIILALIAAVRGDEQGLLGALLLVALAEMARLQQLAPV